jgi:hypothetical protein
LSKSNVRNFYHGEKDAGNFLATSVFKKTAQSKQLHNSGKIVQSGHPGVDNSSVHGTSNDRYLLLITHTHTVI